MSLSLVRRTALHSCAAAALLAFCAPIAAQAQEQTYSFNIPAQALAPALNAFGRQSRQQVVFDGGAFGDQKSSPVVGSYTANQALNALLAGTGFSARLGSKGEFVIAKASGTGTANPAPEQTGQVDEVIVTAEKREEALSKVPLPVSAIASETLVDRNLVRLKDYYTTIPGVLIQENHTSEAAIGIRGMISSGGNPTVGITLDGVSVGSSTGNGGGIAIPEIDAGNLARIEVLRGPQGTLYGANNLAGLLNYVTVDPSASGRSGYASAGLETVDYSRQTGFDVRAGANVPISDTLAVRLSGFYRFDPGYINNIQTGQDGVNRLTNGGGYLAMMWTPSSSFSVKLSALLQDSQSPGEYITTSVVGAPFNTQSFLPGTGKHERTLQIYNATIKGKWAGVDITSITGYSANRISDLADYSTSLSGLAKAAIPNAGPGIAEPSINNTDKFSQELRVSGSLFSGKIDWRVGGFYTYEDTSPNIIDVESTTATGKVIVDAWKFSFPLTYQEYAAFADATVHVTDKFSIELGGRDSQNRQHYTETDSGPIQAFVGPTDPFTYPTINTSDNSFTYSFSPKYNFNDHTMVYGRIASGYSPGGPNVEVNTSIAKIIEFKPQTTVDYEIGLKGKLLNNILEYDLSIYHIDWNDIQIPFFDGTFGYTGNGGAAKSEGIEASGAYHPFAGLTLSGWFDYDNAVLTKAFPANLSSLKGKPGDRLPLTATYSGNASIEYRFPVTDKWMGSVAAQGIYVGDRVEAFGATGDQMAPAYTELNMQAGLDFESWKLNLFVKNVGNSIGPVTIQRVAGNQVNIAPITPRTVGFSVRKTF